MKTKTLILVLITTLTTILFTTCRKEQEFQYTVDGIPGEPVMIYVEGGTFIMVDEPEPFIVGEREQEVTLTSYNISKYPVTQGQWKAIMGDNPAINNQQDDYPVENVSWDEIHQFINLLNEKSGKNYRLPTEAEWEYAARGGKKSKNYKYSGSNNINDVAWYSNNSGGSTQPVCKKQPNELGIFDMTGNVYEMCSDWWGIYTGEPKLNPTGADDGTGKVVRGGSVNEFEDRIRVDKRNAVYPYEKNPFLGFRLVLPTNNLPSITTLEPSKITMTTAILGGIISNIGNQSFTERGICYSTTPNPTIYNTKKTVSGSGTGSYTTTVTGLQEWTTFYIRAYMITGGNTYYGEEFSFTSGEPEMVYLQSGTFTMGCTQEQGSDCQTVEKPEHQVTLNSFSIGRYEITQEQWIAVMGNNPSEKNWDNRLPVENVSWEDIVGTKGDYVTINGINYYEDGFIYRLNQITGKQYRLPTEAEWEFAARGGNKSKNYKYSGSDWAVQVALTWEYSNQTTHQVGTRYPNELGIYDMSGNVWEWVSDWFGLYTSDSQNNPTGPQTGTYRVYRGGSWSNDYTYSRVSYRYLNYPDYKYSNLGFRVALSLE